jgi:hypothetical protein
MLYERKFPDVESHVHLEIRYKEGEDLAKRVYQGQEQYHMLCAISNNKRVVYSGKMSMNMVQKIVNEPEVIWVEGHTRMSVY